MRRLVALAVVGAALVPAAPGASAATCARPVFEVCVLDGDGLACFDPVIVAFIREVCVPSDVTLSSPDAAATCVRPAQWHWVCVEDGEVCVFWSKPPEVCVPTGVTR